MPIISPKKIIDNIVRKKGLTKNNVVAFARDILVKEI
tara:strand:+ start:583 stop:693 length:111 start_codon:yes stop_codon:yes gene_type:complete